MAGVLVKCSSAAVHLQKQQSQSLRLDPYVSHREGSIVVLLAANLDTYGLLTLGRPSVRCYSTLRAWSPVCGSTLRVSQEGNDGCSRLQGLFFYFFRMLWYECFFFGDAELFSPSMISHFLKDTVAVAKTSDS